MTGDGVAVDRVVDTEKYMSVDDVLVETVCADDLLRDVRGWDANPRNFGRVLPR